MENTTNYIFIQEKVPEHQQHEDVALKTCMQLQAERIKAAYKITSAATQIDAEDLRRIEAVIYAMADKFLESDELKQIMEDISMTRLGKMLLEK